MDRKKHIEHLMRAAWPTDDPHIPPPPPEVLGKIEESKRYVMEYRAEIENPKKKPTTKKGRRNPEAPF